MSEEHQKIMRLYTGLEFCNWFSKFSRRRRAASRVAWMRGDDPCSVHVRRARYLDSTLCSRPHFTTFQFYIHRSYPQLRHLRPYLSAPSFLVVRRLSPCRATLTAIDLIAGQTIMKQITLAPSNATQTDTTASTTKTTRDRIIAIAVRLPSTMARAERTTGIATRTDTTKAMTTTTTNSPSTRTAERNDVGGHTRAPALLDTAEVNTRTVAAHLQTLINNTRVPS